ncbi:MAG TPA: o-succinylbenzoate--CoA ligase [Caldithrix abyssi]|uniref:O-succinylbenzoate--CoA ligase n=1 Tax=Caldithrix abyssi TaxID=187145 RepID=A0A7V4WX81_CALAY|nr:o-succinylbenzoate--CoA ligase [Caldithrix abyssi]
MKIPFLINRAARQFGERPALISGGETVSYAEYERNVARAAKILSDLGLRPHERAALYGKPAAKYVYAFWAAMALKSMVVPLNTRLPLDGLKAQLRQTGCSFLVADHWPENATRNALFFPMNDLVRMDEKRGTIPAQIDERQPATIVFTSGSSGEPSPAVLTYGNHYYNALGSNENIRLNPGDRWLLSLPLYHVAGISILFRAALAGAAVIVPDANNRLAEQILESRPTHISLVAAQLAELLEIQDIRSVMKNMRAILLGGSAISHKLIKRAFEAGWPLFVSYGSTQMASQITTTTPAAGLEELFTSGFVLPYREVRIGENAEILVKGQTLFSGYWEKGKIVPAAVDDGWFRTGDAGFFDVQNRLVVQGRLDRMFISGGENIHPEEIERELLKIEGVRQAVVVAYDDDRFGQRPAAFVKGIDWNEQTVEKIKALLRRSLPAYKIPDRFLPWPDDAPQGMKTPWKWFEKAIKN